MDRRLRWKHNSIKKFHDFKNSSYFTQLCIGSMSDVNGSIFDTSNESLPVLLSNPITFSLSELQNGINKLFEVRYIKQEWI